MSAETSAQIYWTPFPRIQGLLLPDTEWRYSKKHEAQQIVPCLWLGPFCAANDEQYMKRLGITHIIIVRSTEEAPFLKPKFPQSFLYETIEISCGSMLQVLNDGVQAISKAVSEGGQVLVHGNAGIARSACVVSAYIMATFRIRLEEAVYYVGTRRHSVTMDNNLKKQLAEFEIMCGDSQIIGQGKRQGSTSNEVTSEVDDAGERLLIVQRESGPRPAMVVKGTAPRELPERN